MVFPVNTSTLELGFLNNGLPDDVMRTIFSHLDFISLTAASSTCRNWRVLGSEEDLWDQIDMETGYPGSVVIDEAFWNRSVNCISLGIDPSGAPQLRKRELVRKVHELFQATVSSPRVLKQVTILTVPRNISFNIFDQIGASFSLGSRVDPRIQGLLGDEKVPQTYIALIPNMGLPDVQLPLPPGDYSEEEFLRHIDAVSKQKLVCQTRNPRWNLPRIIDAFACEVMRYKYNSVSGRDTRGFSTRCLEDIDNPYHHIQEDIHGRITIGCAAGVNLDTFPNGITVAFHGWEDACIQDIVPTEIILPNPPPIVTQ